MCARACASDSLVCMSPSAGNGPVPSLFHLTNVVHTHINKHTRIHVQTHTPPGLPALGNRCGSASAVPSSRGRMYGLACPPHKLFFSPLFPSSPIPSSSPPPCLFSVQTFSSPSYIIPEKPHSPLQPFLSPSLIGCSPTKSSFHLRPLFSPSLPSPHHQFSLALPPLIDSHCLFAVLVLPSRLQIFLSVLLSFNVPFFIILYEAFAYMLPFIIISLYFNPQPAPSPAWFLLLYVLSLPCTVLQIH